MSDHERIWLEPAPGADEDYGRQWCQHSVWDEATEYVRADLHEDAIEERDRLREALIRQSDNMAFVINHISMHDGWYEKFQRELEEDRAVLSPPTAEGREPWAR